jgi:Dolichyl-phosphate-mannose-protein mannosyltransferase
MKAGRAGNIPGALLARPVIAAFVIRLALLGVAMARTGTAVIASGDTASYLIPGRNLLFHGRFFTAGLPEIDRTPGYALFLALASLPGAAFAAFVQVIVSAVSVILVARLARAVTGDGRIALAAAWIFAFEPASIIYSPRLLPETLFVALLLLSLERVAVFLHDRRLRALAAAGLWLTAAIFVRPAGYYLPFALAFGLFVALARVRGVRWKAPAVFLIAVLPWLAAWQVRNRVETGFGGFSSIVARNLYFYQAAEVEARAEHKSFGEVQAEFGYPNEQSYRARHPEQTAWSQSRRTAFMASSAARILSAHPGIAVRMYAEGAAVVAFTPCAAELLRLADAWPRDWPARVVDRGPIRSAWWLLRRHPGAAAVLAALELVLLVLYLLAMRGAARMGAMNAQLWLLAGVALYFIAVSGGAQAVGRYRLPAMPEVCVLAAAGWLRKFDRAEAVGSDNRAGARSPGPHSGIE